MGKLKSAGARVERALVNKIRSEGGWAVRAPASLGPFDVVAFWNGKILLIQCKSCRDDKCYVGKSEVENMLSELEAVEKAVKGLIPVKAYVYVKRRRKKGSEAFVEVKKKHKGKSLTILF
ncbi:hypothetical protein DRN86_03660, partial [Candidatus Geothermarchaeota archaeon]